MKTLLVAIILIAFTTTSCKIYYGNPSPQSRCQFKKYKPKAKREIKPGEGDFLTGEFLAWERNDLIEEIANKKSLNGKDLAKDMDEVLFEVDALSIQMKSTDILQTYEDEDGNVKTVIVNAPDQVKRKRANYKYDKGTGK